MTKKRTSDIGLPDLPKGYSWEIWVGTSPSRRYISLMSRKGFFGVTKRLATERIDGDPTDTHEIISAARVIASRTGEIRSASAWAEKYCGEYFPNEK